MNHGPLISLRVKDLVLNPAEIGSIFVVMFRRVKKDVFLVCVYIDEDLGMGLTLIPAIYLTRV